MRRRPRSSLLSGLLFTTALFYQTAAQAVPFSMSTTLDLTDGRGIGTSFYEIDFDLANTNPIDGDERLQLTVEFANDQLLAFLAPLDPDGPLFIDVSIETDNVVEDPPTGLPSNFDVSFEFFDFVGDGGFPTSGVSPFGQCIQGLRDPFGQCGFFPTTFGSTLFPSSSDGFQFHGIHIDFTVPVNFSILPNARFNLNLLVESDEPPFGTFQVVDGIMNVPEPATLALLAIGVTGMGFSRRRRRSG